MATPFPMPTHSIQLSLADPLTTPDFTDITGLVKSWQGKIRGRQHELQRFEAGNPSWVLNNNDGRFSPWNTAGPYYNLLSPDDASQDASNGSWGNASNLTIAAWGAAPPVVLDGPFALKLTGNGSTPSTVRTGNALYVVTPGNTYTAMCSFLTSVTARAWTVGIAWYTSGGALISTSTGSSVNDNTATWTKATVAAATAPATAAFAAVIVTGTALANAEVHWACRAAIFNAFSQVPNTAWAPGQRTLGPKRVLKVTATWSSTTYNVFYGYVNNWLPTYGQVKTEQVISVSDGLSILAQLDLDTSTYANQVVADGATAFYRQNDPVGSGVNGMADAVTPTAPGSYWNGVVLGAAQMLLTDDATSASYNGGSAAALGSGLQYASAPAGVTGTVWSFEFMFNAGTTIPTANYEAIVTPALGGTVTTTQQQVSVNLIYSGAAGGPGSFVAGDIYLIIEAPNGTLLVSGGANVLGGNVGSLCDGKDHVVTCVRNGTAVSMYVDGALRASGTLTANTANTAPSGSVIGNVPAFTGGTTLAFGGLVANVSYYTGVALTGTQAATHATLALAGWVTQDSGARISAILSVLKWPATLQNIATGISLVQGATSSLTGTAALGYMQTVEQTEQGALFCDGAGVVQFLNRHYILTNALATTSNGTFASDTVGGHFHFLPQSLIPADDDLDTWNDVPSQRQGGVLQRAQDLTSIKQNTRKTLTGFTSGLQTNDNENLAQAQWLLAHYKTPITRVRQITLDSASDDGANLPQMLGRGILDRITVRWKPIDGSNVTLVQDSLIESITHTVTQGRWVTTWALTPAETQGYLVLNDAVYGKLDSNRLGY